MFTDLFDLFIFSFSSIYDAKYRRWTILHGPQEGSVRDDVRAQSARPSGRDSKNVLCSCLLSYECEPPEPVGI